MKYKLLNLTTISLLILCACGDSAPGYSIHTELQNNYLNDSYDNFTKYVDGQSDNSKPAPYVVDLTGVSKGATVTTYEGDKVVDTFSYTTDTSSYDLYNLKVGTSYKTTITSEGSEVKTINYSISDVAPRNLYVDGVTNCRDLGGWKIDKKTRVKQGLIYRTAKYNDDESTDLLITEKGIDTLKNTLGVKTEIDFRATSNNENGGITTSPLGDGVIYISYPMASSGNVLTLNKTKLKGLFDIFGDENNYPIAFHCSIGTDRTGLVAFLINALLGVAEQDLYRDYLFSNFGFIHGVRTSNTIKTYIETLDLSSGKNLSEKVANYLTSAGVASSTLNKIKELMIEKY